MQLGQEVTVSQSHFIPIQKAAVGDLDILDAVVVDLIRQWGVEILIQLLQCLQKSALQTCKETQEVIIETVKAVFKLYIQYEQIIYF